MSEKGVEPLVPNLVLLIDLENCPSQIDHLIKNLEQFSLVVICYAQSGAKVPIDWILPLTSAVNTNKLKLFKTPGTGKNAAASKPSSRPPITIQKTF